MRHDLVHFQALENEGKAIIHYTSHVLLASHLCLYSVRFMTVALSMACAF